MDLIGELPLTDLSGLVTYAAETEAEEAARPLYIAHYMIQKMNGADPMGYDAYLSQILGKEGKTTAAHRRPEEIEKDLAGIEAAYRAGKGA